jgi:tetratricopeptide (TPR) repeat protein
MAAQSGLRANEFLGATAAHYERAGDTGNALEYFSRAGKDRRPQLCNAAALEYVGRALALVPADDQATRFALLSTRIGIYKRTGRRSEQADDVALLEQTAEALDDDALRARSAASRASLALVLNDYSGTVTARRARSGPGRARQGSRRSALGADQLGDARCSSRATTPRHRPSSSNRSSWHAKSATRSSETTALAQHGILSMQRGRYGTARDHYRKALGLRARSATVR